MLLFVLVAVRLLIHDYAFNVLLCQTTFVVDDGNFVCLSVRWFTTKTLRMPLASMSKVTSIWRTRELQEEMPNSSNLSICLCQYV